MNLYIVVEGEQTETKIYPAWLQILVPQLHRIDDAWNLSENSDSYYTCLVLVEFRLFISMFPMLWQI